MKLVIRLRQIHAALAPFVLAPLLITALSGVSYRVLRDWGGFSRDQVHWLMAVHEAEWLGPSLEPLVVLLNGLGLLWMLVTGAGMLAERLLRRFRRPAGGTEG
ncbi:PepSY domain-containing protein [Synechococcus sp. RSCCF101]|uniref:PepSY domain-containing protein n=1 Tax=Synechococcus sp. RSCCF101 TaxID=2511069 RepID=UPI0012481493|nr:PepSY domain-containing protein [Synechococcus sp. RSCCF101]QEY32021.1 PepSY domain-containing protein [Synechococcus sp. RSCCF101]